MLHAGSSTSSRLSRLDEIDPALERVGELIASGGGFYVGGHFDVQHEMLSELAFVLMPAVKAVQFERLDLHCRGQAHDVPTPLVRADQTEIANFWADGEGTVTPPGHWNRIAATVARDRALNRAETARLFAMLNVALADAAIACWECKFRFDVWRPVTAIRNAEQLKNPDLVADPDWTPLLVTPPFPSYTSGHSSFSGAAAAETARGCVKPPP